MPVGSEGGLVLFGSAILRLCCMVSEPYIYKFVVCKKIKNIIRKFYRQKHKR